MEYYYNWQRPYHHQYSNSSNLNPYFNNSYEYLHSQPQQQQANKPTYYNWNNYLPQSHQIVSISTPSHQSQTLSQPPTKNQLPSTTPLPIQVPASTPVSFQPPSTSYYDPFTGLKKKSNNNIQYTESIYYNHDHDYYRFSNSNLLF